MTNTIKWDKPCYKCLSHLCDLSCEETSKTEEQDDEVLGFNGWGFPIEKPNKVMTTQTEVLKLARQLLWRYRHETPIGRQPHMICQEVDEAFERIDEALAQPEQPRVRTGDCLLTGVCASEGHKIQLKEPEQEPVAWRVSYPDEPELGFWFAEGIGGEGCLNEPLYTTPPQRTWVGLTDEEINDLVHNHDDFDGLWEFTDAVEAKLKEKNNA